MQLNQVPEYKKNTLRNSDLVGLTDIWKLVQCQTSSVRSFTEPGNDKMSQRSNAAGNVKMSPIDQSGPYGRIISQSVNFFASLSFSWQPLSHINAFYAKHSGFSSPTKITQKRC